MSLTAPAGTFSRSSKLPAIMSPGNQSLSSGQPLLPTGIFDCKPLGFIWAKFPEYYNEANTIMFDDLRRNYVMNKQNGLVIAPYKRAHTNRDTDKELLHLTQYLLCIAPLERLSDLNHRKWRQYIDRRGRHLL